MSSTIIIAGLRCRRCDGTSSIELDPRQGLVNDKVVACPHCFTENIEHQYMIGSMYDVENVIPVDAAEFEATGGIDEYEYDVGALTEKQFERWRAVRCRGYSYALCADEHGVTQSSVWQSVKQATERLSEEDDE